MSDQATTMPPATLVGELTLAAEVHTREALRDAEALARLARLDYERTAAEAPGPFLRARHALRWYWHEAVRRASPPALDPGRQNIQGSSDGTLVIAGQRVCREGVFASMVLCLGTFSEPERRILFWGAIHGTEAEARLSGADAQAWSIRYAVLARDVTRWLREHGMLQEG